MSLRTRLSATMTILTLSVVTGFGGLAYLFFVQQQQAQLRRLLADDLARVATLLARPTLGSSFAGSASASSILQFVTPDDRIVVSWGGDTLLPSPADSEVVRLGERIYLVGQAPWPATGGTIRLAHDVSSAFRSRTGLARSLLLSGLLIALLATLGGAFGTRRALRPLARLTSQARRIDPVSPEAIAYRGPKDEIHALSEALNTSIATLRTRQADERAFLLEIAHELAAPLTLVNYHLKTVRGDHPHDGRLRAAAEASQELLRTSQDLLVLARGELERPLEFEVVSLARLVARVADEYPGVQIDARISGEVVGDPERLMQVLRNLVRNGVQAARGPDGVRLRLRAEGAEQVIEVCDTGPGMSETTLARVFERHYGSGRGSGVGLTICKALVEQHGGSIRASSTPGKGSCFEVRLPSLSARLDPRPLPATTS